MELKYFSYKVNKILEWELFAKAKFVTDKHLRIRNK